MPAGCFIHLDKMAQDAVEENVRKVEVYEVSALRFLTFPGPMSFASGFAFAGRQRAGGFRSSRFDRHELGPHSPFAALKTPKS